MSEGRAAAGAALGPGGAGGPAAGRDAVTGRGASLTRAGVVRYLNARPLVDALAGDETFALVPEVPSALVDMLRRGEVDLALVPAVAAAGGDYVVCPGVAIGSWGPVRSVRVYHRRPIRSARRIALDPASRSSAALVRVLCEHAWGVRPELIEADGPVNELLDEFCAVLRIGDRCLMETVEGDAIDLGSAWSELTDLPFVYAFWAARAGALDDTIPPRLVAARDAGMARLREIAGAFAAEADWGDGEAAFEYLRDHIRYDLGPAEIEGLSVFYRLAAELGAIDHEPRLRFFGE